MKLESITLSCGLSLLGDELFGYNKKSAITLIIELISDHPVTIFNEVQLSPSLQHTYIKLIKHNSLYALFNKLNRAFLWFILYIHVILITCYSITRLPYIKFDFTGHRHNLVHAVSTMLPQVEIHIYKVIKL